MVGACLCLSTDRLIKGERLSPTQLVFLPKLNSKVTNISEIMNGGEARRYFPSTYKKANCPGMIEKVGILGEEMIFNVILRTYI